MIDTDRKLTPIETLNLYNLETIIQEKTLDYLWEFQPRSSMIDLYNNLFKVAEELIPEQENKEELINNVIGSYLEEKASAYNGYHTLPVVSETDPSPLTKEQRENRNGPWKEREEREAVVEQKEYINRLKNLNTSMIKDIKTLDFSNIDKRFEYYQTRWEAKYQSNSYKYDKIVDWDTDKAPRTHTYKKKMLVGHIYEQYLSEEIEKYGLDVGLYYNKDGQEHGESELGVEFKNDLKSQDTGNIYFELAEKSRNSSVWNKSGIMKDDNTSFVIIGRPDNYFIVLKEDLVELFKKNEEVLKNNYTTEKGYKQYKMLDNGLGYTESQTSKGFIVNASVIERLCYAKSIDALIGRIVVCRELGVEEIPENLDRVMIDTSVNMTKLMAAKPGIIETAIDKEHLTDAKHSFTASMSDGRPWRMLGITNILTNKANNTLNIPLEYKDGGTTILNSDAEFVAITNISSYKTYNPETKSFDDDITYLLSKKKLENYIKSIAYDNDQLKTPTKDTQVPYNQKTNRVLEDYNGTKYISIPIRELVNKKVLVQDNAHIFKSAHTQSVKDISSLVYASILNSDENALTRDQIQGITQKEQGKDLAAFEYYLDKEELVSKQNNIFDLNINGDNMRFIRADEDKLSKIPETITKMEIINTDIPKDAGVFDLSKNNQMLIAWMKDDTLYVKTNEEEISQIELQGVVDSIYKNTQIESIVNHVKEFQGVDLDRDIRMSIVDEYKFGYVNLDPESQFINTELGDLLEEFAKQHMVADMHSADKLVVAHYDNMAHEDDDYFPFSLDDVDDRLPFSLDDITEEQAEEYFNMCHFSSNEDLEEERER